MAAVTVTALAGTVLTPLVADAAPGETWAGTLKVTEQRSGNTTTNSGFLNYSKLHVTTFAVVSSSGEDDDPNTQPVADWETTVDHRHDYDGDCDIYEYDYYQGEVAGSGGVLELTPDTAAEEPRVRIHIADHGPSDTFLVPRRYLGCNDITETMTTADYPHQGFTVIAPGDLATATQLQGSRTELRSDGSTTYEWNLTRRTEQGPTDGDDVLTGTDGDDFIELLGGNDIYNAVGGNDQVFGGDGDDDLAGGPGDDVLDGGKDKDLLLGGDGSDELRGGAGADQLSGDGANEIVIDDSNPNRATLHLTTFGGPDLLFGGAGPDRLVGGKGFDRLNGGPGKDVCIVNSRKEKRRARGCETIKLRRSR